MTTTDPGDHLIPVPAPVVALRDAWAAWQASDSFPYSRDHCLNGTRVGIDVLRRFRVHARPCSVQLAVFNAAAYDLWTHGVDPSAWPEHAWSVGIAGTGEVSNPGAPHRQRSWDGHLLIDGDGWLLDLSAGQFHRPGRIVCPEPIILPGWDEGGALLAVDEHRQRWLINPHPVNNAWRHATGWTGLQGPAVDLMSNLTNDILIEWARRG